MSTKVKRTAVTLSQGTDATLAKLAALQRRPKARIIAELLDEIAPSLGRIAELLELAAKNREALPSDAAMRLGALEELVSHNAQFALDRMAAVVDPQHARGKRSVPGRAALRKKRH